MLKAQLGRKKFEKEKNGHKMDYSDNPAADCSVCEPDRVYYRFSVVPGTGICERISDKAGYTA